MTPLIARNCLLYGLVEFAKQAHLSEEGFMQLSEAIELIAQKEHPTYRDWENLRAINRRLGQRRLTDRIAVINLCEMLDILTTEHSLEAIRDPSTLLRQQFNAYLHKNPTLQENLLRSIESEDTPVHRQDMISAYITGLARILDPSPGAIRFHVPFTRSVENSEFFKVFSAIHCSLSPRSIFVLIPETTFSTLTTEQTRLKTENQRLQDENSRLKSTLAAKQELADQQAMLRDNDAILIRELTEKNQQLQAALTKAGTASRISPTQLASLQAQLTEAKTQLAHAEDELIALRLTLSESSKERQAKTDKIEKYGRAIKILHEMVETATNWLQSLVTSAEHNEALRTLLIDTLPANAEQKASFAEEISAGRLDKDKLKQYLQTAKLIREREPTARSASASHTEATDSPRASASHRSSLVSTQSAPQPEPATDAVVSSREARSQSVEASRAPHWLSGVSGVFGSWGRRASATHSPGRKDPGSAQEHSYY